MFVCAQVRVCMDMKIGGQPQVSILKSHLPYCFLNYFIILLFICMCAYLCVGTGALRRQKCLVPFKVQLQVVVDVPQLSAQIGLELRSSESNRIS